MCCVLIIRFCIYLAVKFKVGIVTNEYVCMRHRKIYQKKSRKYLTQI